MKSYLFMMSFVLASVSASVFAEENLNCSVSFKISHIVDGEQRQSRDVSFKAPIADRIYFEEGDPTGSWNVLVSSKPVAVGPLFPGNKDGLIPGVALEIFQPGSLNPVASTVAPLNTDYLSLDYDPILRGSHLVRIQCYQVHATELQPKP